MIGKQKLSVTSEAGGSSIKITEQVKNRPAASYRAPLTESLTRAQALKLGLLLIKAAQS